MAGGGGGFGCDSVEDVQPMDIYIIYIYIYLYLDIFITWSIDLPDRAERFDDYLWLDGPILFLILI